MKTIIATVSHKKVHLQTSCGRNFQVDAHEILDDRSNYYASIDDDTCYQEEYEAFMDDDFEITDWLQNNMDWFKCKTLKELPRDKSQSLHSLDVIEVEVVKDEK